MAGKEPSNGYVVVVGVDESNTAEHAFDWYLEHLHFPEFKVIVVHGLEVRNAHPYPSPFVRPEILEAEFEREKSRSQDVEDKYKAKIEEKQISGEYLVFGGTAGEVIVKAAKDYKASLIVVGTRGWGTVRRTILGSVSHYVLHHAHCAVVTVRKEFEI